MTDSLEDPITLLVLLVGVGGASGVCVGLCGGLLGEVDLSDDLDDATTAPEDDASNITSAQAAAARERARMALFGVSLGAGAGAMAGLLASTLILSSHDGVNSRPALPTLLSALLPLLCVLLGYAAYRRRMAAEYRTTDASWALLRARREAHAAPLVLVRAEELLAEERRRQRADSGASAPPAPPSARRTMAAALAASKRAADTRATPREAARARAQAAAAAELAAAAAEGDVGEGLRLLVSLGVDCLQLVALAACLQPSPPLSELPPGPIRAVPTFVRLLLLQLPSDDELRALATNAHAAARAASQPHAHTPTADVGAFAAADARNALLAPALALLSLAAGAVASGWCRRAPTPPRRRGGCAEVVAELALCTCALPLLRLLLLAVHCDAAVDGGGAGGRLPMATDGECWSSWGRAASAAAAALVLLPWVRAVLHHAMLNARLGVGVGWRFGWGWLQAKILLAAAATWPHPLARPLTRSVLLPATVGALLVAALAAPPFALPSANRTLSGLLLVCLLLAVHLAGAFAGSAPVGLPAAAAAAAAVAAGCLLRRCCAADATHQASDDGLRDDDERTEGWSPDGGPIALM